MTAPANNSGQRTENMACVLTVDLAHFAALVAAGMRKP